MLRALAWWTLGVLLTAAALLLAEPATHLYVAVADVSSSDHLADVLVVGLCVSLALATWRRTGARATATGLAAGVGVVLAYGTSEALKLVVAQERPCHTVLPDPQCPGAGNWSFPSNHATVAFALATAVVLVCGTWWAWSAYLAAVATAGSRVVDGVHLPHDVLAGAALGTCTTVAAAILLTPWTGALVERLRRHQPSGSEPPHRG